MTNQTDKLTFITGTIMAITGVSAFLIWPLLVLLNIELTFLNSDIPLYILSTFAATVLAWGWILVKASKQQQWVDLIALPTAIGFGMLAAVRFFSYGGSEDMNALVGAAPLGEAVLFSIIMALYLTKDSASKNALAKLGDRPATFGARMLQLWRSFRAIPSWVQIWVMFFLSPINMLALFILDTDLGKWTILAGAFVLLSNGTIMFTQARLSSVMSVPHLLPWGALQVYVGVGLVNGIWSGWMLAYAVALFVLNGISLVFDVLDSKKWLNGEHGFV